MKSEIRYHGDQGLRDEILSALESYPQFGALIFKARNTVRMGEIGGRAVAIKEFRKPSLFHSYYYAAFKPSKAMRSFTHSETLLAKGFHVPQPIAAIEVREAGRLRKSYYVCDQARYDFDFRTLGTLEPQERKAVFAGFAQTAFNLHEAGIAHNDLSPGNILVSRRDAMGKGAYEFMLIDLNRMRFGALSYQDRLKNLYRVTENLEFLSEFGTAYADVAALDKQAFSQQLISTAQRIAKFNQARRSMKNALKSSR